MTQPVITKRTKNTKSTKKILYKPRFVAFVIFVARVIVEPS